MKMIKANECPNCGCNATMFTETCPRCGYSTYSNKRSLADELKDEGLCRLGELLNEGEVHELVMLAEAGKLFNKQGKIV